MEMMAVIFVHFIENNIGVFFRTVINKYQILHSKD